MKAILSTALVLLICSTAIAQEDHAEDRAVLRQLKDQYEKAVNEANADLLAPYIAEDFTGVVATNEQITGLAGLKDYWKHMQNLLGPGGKVNTKVSFEPSIIAGDLAISHGNTDSVVTTSSGATYHYISHWTALSRKSANDWKLVRIHDSIDPINNEFAEMFSRYRALKYAAISGIAALVLGILIGRLTKRAARVRSS